MRLQPAVKEETARIGAGTGILACLMVAVFALLGRLDMPVVWGTLLGAGFAVLNFFLLAVSVQVAAEKMEGARPAPLPEDEGEAPAEPPLSPEAIRARNGMRLSYMGRMLLTAGVALLAVGLPCFNPIATILCMLFPRLVIFMYGLKLRREPKKEDKAP